MHDAHTPTHFLRFNLPLRALLIDDQPWFVASDFCRLIGHRHPERIGRALDDDQRALVRLREGEGESPVEVLSESGAYAVFYRYRHPENRHLRRWLTQEVIPSLRGLAQADDGKPRRVLLAWEGTRVSLLEWQGGLWVPLEQLPRFSAQDASLRQRGSVLARWWPALPG
ncbi:BRO-N domain-containing protein [Pseudomonas panipatensis]|uniref:Prophage antirepressor n=1 Tax=Pseudomonas panipatensis TaxID=428992 RepID=A0A1G8EQ55_9PSED|nr:BRO family protein [Pseudomonas panipatensis]SDH71829.1 Prophage antirepressor [Pseudomonas panipatensis]SMP68681.1 Prophage antirepressor [Pseudomonas panipatensis]